MSIVAGCKFCGATDLTRRPTGPLGKPAGPCRSCGRLMFWMIDTDEARPGPTGVQGPSSGADRRLSATRSSS